MRRFKTALTVIGAVTVLVLAGNTVAFAATGGKFFLGKVNYANKQSTLVRTTSGPALKLATKYAANPPLATNGKGKVANLNADMLDGLDSSKFAIKQQPVKVWNATPLPSRQVTVSGVTTVQQVAVSVPGECGSATRHKYLVEHEAWWAGSGALVEISLTLDTTSQQFGPGSSVVQPNTYASSASSRVLILAPGAHTIRLVAGPAASTTALDPALHVMDLGYTCSGGPTSRVAASRTGARVGGIS